MNDERTSRTLSLTTGGITLLGVLLSIGVTVGMDLTRRGGSAFWQGSPRRWC